MAGEAQTFVIFGRKKYDEPLMELGTVEASGIEAAGQATQEAYPHDEWLEMIAIPRTAIVSVIESETA